MPSVTPLRLAGVSFGRLGLSGMISRQSSFNDPSPFLGVRRKKSLAVQTPDASMTSRCHVVPNLRDAEQGMSG